MPRCSTPGPFSMVSSRRATASSAPGGDPPLTCQQPWPLRPELSMHSWSTRKTQLRLSLSPPHSELLPTRQGYAHQASRTKTDDWLFSLSVVHDQACRTSLQESHQTFEGLHVLGVWLLHPSRKFLRCELQLTSVLTEIAGPHRPRSVASSTLCIKLLAIFFISRPHTKSTHSFAFVAQSHL